MNFIENRISLYEDASFYETNGKLRLISTIPRSGTWSQHYFWAVYDALGAGLKGYDPFPNFYTPKYLNADVFGITHYFCPGWKDVLPQETVDQLQHKLYPALPGVDWATPELDKRFGDTYKPHCNKNCRIVLIYRNPLDQLASYYRQTWSKQSRLDTGLTESDNIQPYLADKNGQRVYLQSMKEVLRAGALESYCIFLKTYMEMAKLFPKQIKLIQYEKIVEGRYSGFKSIDDFLELSVGFDENLFRKSLKLTEKTNLSNLEKSLGRSITYEERIHADRPKNEITKHIYSKAAEEWRDVFDAEDIAYTVSKLEIYGIEARQFKF